MTPAELAATRHLLGLTGDGLAQRLRVNPRTVRAWEAGRDPIPARIVDELAELRRAHDALVREIVGMGDVVVISRRGQDAGWQLGAAARALELDPRVMLEWAT